MERMWMDLSDRQVDESIVMLRRLELPATGDVLDCHTIRRCRVSLEEERAIREVERASQFQLAI